MTPLSFLATLLVSQATPSAALQPECDPNDPTICSVALPQGTPAPWTGQLLTIEAAIALGIAADDCDRRIAIEVVYSHDMLKVDLEYERRVHAIDAEAWHKERGLLLDHIDRLEHPPFYKQPWFIVTGTAAAIVITAIVIGR